MKTIVTFLLAVIASVQVHAQNKLNIVVFSDDGEPFYVVINGIRQNMNPETNVRVTDLASESLSFKIIFKDEKIPAISKTQYAPFGMEYTFRIKKDKKGNRNLKYFGEVELESSPNTSVPSVAYHATETTGTTGTVNTTTTGNENTGTVGVGVGVSGTGTEATTTTTQTTTVVTTGGTTGGTTTTTGTTGTGENVNVGVNMGGVGFNMNVNVNETGTGNGGNVSTGVGVNGTESGTVTTGTNYSETTTTTTTTTSSTTYGTGGTSSTTVSTTGSGTGTTTGTTGTTTSSSSGGCYYPIGDTDYQDIQKSVKSKTFSDTKMTLAKQVTKNNCLSSVQVKGIAELFDFEADKLTYAKYAYDFVYDKNNYYKINDIFDFESSTEELDKYISSK